MATANLCRDTRGKDNNESCPVKIIISHKSSPAHMSTGLYATLDEWNEIINPDNGEVVFRGFSSKKKNYKALNDELQDTLLGIRKFIRESELSGRINIYSAIDIRDEYRRSVSEIFSDLTFTEFIEKHKNSFAKPSNREKYQTAQRRIQSYLYSLRGEKYDKEKNPEIKLLFEDITYEWLEDFERWLEQNGTPSANGRRPIFACMRAAFKKAHKRNILSKDIDPFVDFKIKKDKPVKRTFEINILRQIRDIKTDDESINIARDYFLLSFYLIGINPRDMYELKKDSLFNGRISYKRNKTEKWYDIKVYPESMDIISKYPGSVHLISWCDDYSSFKSFYNAMHNGLKKLKEALHLPRLTQYWARHSWSSIAFEAGISKDIVGCALGHEDDTSDVTWGYIQVPQQIIDNANRSVIDRLWEDVSSKTDINLSSEEMLILKNMGFKITINGDKAILRRVMSIMATERTDNKIIRTAGA